jgi:hypothetical protein
MFTTVHHLSLSWARLISSTTSQTISLRSTLMLPSHLFLGIQSGLFPSGFTNQNLVFPLSPVRATWPAHLILFNIHIILGGKNKHLHLSVLHVGNNVSALRSSLPDCTASHRRNKIPGFIKVMHFCLDEWLSAVRTLENAPFFFCRRLYTDLNTPHLPQQFTYLPRITDSL